MKEERRGQNVYRTERDAVVGGNWGFVSSSQVTRSHAGQPHEGWACDFPVSLPSKCTESLLWNIQDLSHGIYLILTIWPRARS